MKGEGPKKGSKGHAKADKSPTSSSSFSSSSSVPSSSTVSSASSASSAAPRGAGANAVAALVRGLSLGPRDGAFLNPHGSTGPKVALDTVPNPYIKSATSRRTSTGASTGASAGITSSASSDNSSSNSGNSGRRPIARSVTATSDSSDGARVRSDKASGNSDRYSDALSSSNSCSSGSSSRRRRGTQGSRSGDWEGAAAALMALPAAMHSLVSPRGTAPGSLSPPPVPRMATMPVGWGLDPHAQRKRGDQHGQKDPTSAPASGATTTASAGSGSGTSTGGGEDTESGSLAARRMRHRSVSTTAASSGTFSMSGGSFSVFAPVAEGEGGLDELQALLADERDRVAALLARRDMLSSEAKRVRGERDEARREQALLTEKLAEMEGRMLALKESHEKELGRLRRDADEGEQGCEEGSDSLSGGGQASLAIGSVALAEQVQVLRLENEGLRVELSGSVRACRELAEEREGAHLRASAVEREVQQLRATNEGLSRTLEAAKARLEQQKQQADEALDRHDADAQALRAQLEAEVGRLRSLVEEKGRALQQEQRKRQEAEEREKGAVQALEREREQRQEVEASERAVSEALEQEKRRRQEAEEREEGVREALEGHQGLVRDKVTALSREKAAALAAGERRAAALQREMSIVLEQKEALAEKLQRLQSLHSSGRNEISPSSTANRRYSPVGREGEGCTGTEREKEFSRALDVARLEVKRLRVQRDLMLEKMRALEQGWGGRGLPMGWFMPDCLVRLQPEPTIFVPNASCA